MKKIAACLLSAAAILSFVAAGYAEEKLLVGSFTSLKGKVNVQRSSEEKWAQAELDMPVYPGDKVKTGTRSEAELILDDGSMLRVEEKTLMEIVDSKIEDGTGEEGKKSVLINLGVGKILNNFKKLLQKESRVNVSTEAAVVGIRGTEFSVEAGEDGKTEVAVFAGSVEVADPAGNAVQVDQDKQTMVEKGKAPHTPQELTEKIRKYREDVVTKFRKRVEDNRLRLEDIRKRREMKIDTMKQKVQDMQDRNKEKIGNLNNRQQQKINSKGK